MPQQFNSTGLDWLLAVESLFKRFSCPSTSAGGAMMILEFTRADEATRGKSF